MIRAVVFLFSAALLLGALDAEAAKRKRRKRRARKGTVQVVSPVNGATVYLDGKLWGTTPVKPLRVAPRKYRVTVQKLGYLEYEQPLHVKPGLKSTVSARLLPIAGVIDIKSGVPAKVLVDGDERGETPLRLELSVGEHEVIVVSGSREESQKVKALAGREFSMAFFGASLGAVAPEPEIALVPPSRLPDADLSLPPELMMEPEETPVDMTAGTKAPEPLAEQQLDVESLPLDLPVDTELALVDPLNPNAVQQFDSTRDKEWYTEWWALTAGGALVVGAVATTIALSGGGGDEDSFAPDATLNTNGQDGVGPTPAGP